MHHLSAVAHRSKLFCRSLVLGAVVCLLALPALAQPLADRVPSDAMLYVGWQGIGSMPGYDQSRLKAFLDDSNIPSLMERSMPLLLDRIVREDPNAAEGIGMLRKIFPVVWKYPTALYFAGIDLSNPVVPTPKLALLCKAGEDGEVVRAEMARIIAMTQGQAPFPIRAVRQGDIVALIVGYEQDAQAIAGSGPNSAKPLAGTSDRFAQAMAQVQKDSAGVFYVDAEAVMGLINMIVQFNPDPAAQQMWPKIREAIGLDGVKRIVATAGFDGREWATNLFVAAPAPRPGMLKLLEAPPISGELMQSIPGTSTSFAILHADFAKVIEEVRTAASALDPNARQMMDGILDFARMQLGFDIQADLFEALGDKWAFYHNPAAMGSGPLGVTVLNRARHPDLAEKCIARLQEMVQASAAEKNRKTDPQLYFERSTIDGVDVRYAALPFVTPAWTLKDSTFYFGLYPQTVAMAASTRVQPITERPGYQALRKRLGPDAVAGLIYIDLPATSDESYQPVLLLSRGLLGIGDMIGLKTPAITLPSLPKLKAHLAPAGMAAWTDDAGMHVRTISPFPMSGVFAMPAAAPAVLPAMAR